MKHFTDTQILQLLEEELRRQLKFAEEKQKNIPDATIGLLYNREVTILRSLVQSLEYYKNYTYEEWHTDTF